MPTKHDAIYDYITEPLLNSYVSNNFKTGLELCHYRLASSINKLDKESVSTGMRYLDALMLFKDKMKKHDYQGACGKLLDAFGHVYSVSGILESENSKKRTELNAYCANIILQVLNESMEVESREMGSNI